MSYDDFCLLSPDEFNAIFEEWKLEQENVARGEWERCRWICYCMIRPYSKKGLRLTDIMKFEWDGKKSGGSKPSKEEREAAEIQYQKCLKLWRDE